MKTISRYIMTLALLLTAVGGAWAADTYTITFSGFGNEACNKTVTDATLEYSETFNFTDVDANYSQFLDLGGSNEYVSISKKNDTQITITVKSAFEGTVNVTVNYVNGDGDESARNISVTCVKSAPTVEVTTNAASKQDLFTEASFKMPTFDVDVNYELVRDMTVDVDATIADRIRIKKENNVYVVVTDGQLTPAVSDKISGTAVAMTATTDYTVKLQKKVEGETPSWADATALSVGTFRYVITGAGLYDGEITTAEFQLFEGYEVTVPAGEYATYYRTDYNLKIDGENTGGKLYTITDVSGSTATATEITSANKAMPFLIYNGNTEAKTFLLIPTDTEITQTFYAGFVGTPEATTIAASSAEQNNYAFNGKQFVWVKTEIAVGANKCWLAIPTGVTSNAREINLVFGNTTGIESIDNPELTIDGWYDLNGRKLQGKPTKKGIYIHNGKKVVVK